MPYTKANRPHWYFDFEIQRCRFFGTLTDETGRPLAKAVRKRIAEEREAIERNRARESLAAGRAKKRMTLDDALGRYYVEHGQYLPSAGNIWTYADNWRRIGRTRRPISLLKKHLDQIADDDIAWYVSVRRGEPVRNAKPKTLEDGTVVQPPFVAKRTVNLDVEFLRDMYGYASRNWGIEIGNALNWSDHLLAVPPPPTRVLTAAEDETLFDVMARLRPDFVDMFEFALLGGWRLMEVVRLDKAKIDRGAMTARVVVKGGREVVKPLTTEMLAIIERNWMHHPTRVFTYVNQANKTYMQKGARVTVRKGSRRPFTKDGWRKQFRTILAEAKVPAFRFHDFRHTAGTRIYRGTRDKLAVQNALSHRDPATSDRYIHAAGEFERDALEAAAAQRVRTKPRHGGGGTGNNSNGTAG